MKKTTFLFMLLSLLTLGARAQLSSNPDKFLGNITTSYQIDYGSEKFYQLWNQITPENESKWASVEGTRGTFNWNSCDNISNYAKSHHFPFKFHTLVWGSQFPGWVKNLSVQERYEAIVKWMDAVKERYPDLELIDVVNEAVDGHQADSHYMSEALGGKGRTGYDWIIKAFQMAYERWPNAILIYNDFNTFQWNTDQYISLVRALRDAGAPVDAYGCQSHDLGGVNQTTFRNVMTKIQDALKMPMYITEYDIADTNDANQKWNYQQHFPVMWEADYCAGVTLWGYIYGKTWVQDGASGIIKDGKDRSAMTWLREYMKSDAAKQAKSPFPGMKKEASIYVKPASLKVAKGDKLPVWVAATMATKTIEKVELYMGSDLVATMTEAPYMAEVSSESTGTKTLKAVVTTTDGTQYERLSRISVLSSTVARSPYNGVVPELPGVVEAMNYDNGADGVAYSNASRTGATKTGGWMEYTVDVKEAGLYSVDIEVAAQNSDGMLRLVDNDFGNMIFLSDFISVPSTGSNSTYKTFHVRLTTPLQAGRRTLCLCIEKGGFNIGKMTFTPLTLNNAIRSTVKVNPATISVGEKTTITATAAVGSTTIANVRIFANGMAVDTLTEKPYTTDFWPTASGTYTITAIATDVEGRESKMPTTTLTVNEAPNSDPNFYVYLCFGQSNMEGNATPEAVDQTVDPRFQTLACVNFTSPQRTMGQWYTATPPIVRQGTGLGMADYFGRTMVKNLPENVKVGVVDVAIGGTKIEGFMQEEVASYITSMNPSSEGWLINYFKAYDNDPYQRLVDMARIAQQKGVIKGILLHQGESNNGQSDWPQKVKKIYDRLIADLGLTASDVPLFVGETVSQAEGGACWYHNTVIAKVPSVIPNSYVISSAGCPQKGDGLHFTAQGYRTMGSRYAQQALKLMGIEAQIDEPQEPAGKAIAERFSSLDAIGTTPFAIVEEESGKALYGIDNQNLGFDTFTTAFVDTNTGYLFQLEESTVNNGYLLRLIQPNGTPYSIWGNPGYLNSQPADQWCSFILGLNNQNGQDMENGAVWQLDYVAGKGFSMKNVGTGKFLHDATPAKYDDPVYFTFCTLGEATGLQTVRMAGSARTDEGIYTLQGVRLGNAEKWGSLPRGLYIVNGKITMKR